MGSSVVIISSVKASFNANSRNVRSGGNELEFYRFPKTAARGIRPVDAPPRVVKTQIHEEHSRLTRQKIIDVNSSKQVPFPSFGDTSENPSASTSPRDPLRCTTDISNGVANDPPQEGLFVRCFDFLKRVGANMILPPYTVDEGLSGVITMKHGYMNLNASMAELPLV